jgi:hypothetical protein
VIVEIPGVFTDSVFRGSCPRLTLRVAARAATAALLVVRHQMDQTGPDVRTEDV